MKSMQCGVLTLFALAWQPTCQAVRSAGKLTQSLAAVADSNSVAEVDVAAASNSTSDPKIMLAMALNKGAGASSNQKHEKWAKFRLGCNDNIEVGICEATLMQLVCERSHSMVSGIGAEEACHEIWHREPKKDPDHMYCLAAAWDPALIRSAEKIRKGLSKEPTIQQCKVAVMPHLKDSKLSGSILSGPAAISLKMPLEVIGKVISTCNQLLHTPLAERDYQGFCAAPAKPGQDCSLAAGLKEHWSDNFGAFFCSGRETQGEKWRCRAFRKQLIRVAQALDLFGRAGGKKFEDLIKISPMSCAGGDEEFPLPEDIDSDVTDVESLEKRVKGDR